jgi:hypothetical protein
MVGMTLESEFLDYSTGRLTLYMSRIEDCVSRLTPPQVWERGSANENSVANLILHLEGNVRQWILSGVAGQPDVRDRHAEFAAKEGLTPNELLAKLRHTVDEAAATIQALDPARLLDRVHPQGNDVSALVAIYQVVQHFAGHAFQIMYATKRFTGQDLGYSAQWNTPK